ncbi:hypothetical protein ACGFRG_03465 [Streptomyces sp. NPDC048696]|uniref:hypothetical protein n=1 Tax=Streptomyces sp. NPDC048696 TaxID=3365585 RepID=UPI0037111979
MGDYVLVAGRYRRVNDMCNRGGATERVLMLEGFGPWVMTTNHLIYRPIKRGHVRTHHASGRQTSMALLSAKVRYRQGGLTVPFITAWDSERITVPRLGVRVSGAGPSIYFADEGPMDRDQHGILWVRQGLGRGRGKALFPTVHAYRQRRAMYDLLCQVYGGLTIEESDTRQLYVMNSARGQPIREGERTTAPPVCRSCAPEASHELPSPHQ